MNDITVNNANGYSGTLHGKELTVSYHGKVVVHTYHAAPTNEEELNECLRQMPENTGRTTMKKLEIEMPDNIDCMIIAYLETVSIGNVNVGQRCVGRHDLNAGKIVIDTTVSELKQEWRKFDEQATEEKESEAPDDADHRGDLR